MNKHSSGLGSDCGTIDRAVTPCTRDPQFESSHWQFSFTINCIGKTKIKEQEPGNCPIFYAFNCKNCFELKMKKLALKLFLLKSII